MTTNGSAAPAARTRGERDRLLGYLALAVSTVGVGSALIFVRKSQVDATATLMLRMLFASLIVGAMTAGRQEKVRFADIRRRDLGLLVLSSLISAGDLAANQWSVNLTAVANTVLLMNLSPVFVFLLGWLVFDERIAMRRVLALGLALAGGVLVVSSGGDHLAFSADRNLLGDGLALASAALYAVYLIFTKQLRERLPTTVIMLGNTLVIMAVLAPIAAATSHPVLPHDWQGYLLIACYALVAQLLGHGLMTYALRTVNTTLASMSALLRPIVAVLLAWLILGEDIQGLQVVGGVVILGSLAWFQLAGPGAKGRAAAVKNPSVADETQQATEELLAPVGQPPAAVGTDEDAVAPTGS